MSEDRKAKHARRRYLNRIKPGKNRGLHHPNHMRVWYPFDCTHACLPKKRCAHDSGCGRQMYQFHNKSDSYKEDKNRTWRKRLQRHAQHVKRRKLKDALKHGHMLVPERAAKVPGDTTVMRNKLARTQFQSS